MRSKSKMPKLVGYSLASSVAAAVTFIFFWVLDSFYEITIIIDADTHVKIGNFFAVLFSIFILIIAFSIFPVILYFLLSLISFLSSKLNKKSVSKKLKANREKIVYYATFGYWFIFAVGLTACSIIFLIK